MIRVRFVAPASGRLLVTGARVALANALFAKAQAGQFTLRLPPGEDRITADLRWLGVAWDSIGESGDHAAAIAHLKAIGRLYPCFESETELRARREYRIRRGQSPVYDRAALKMTEAQRQAAEAGGKTPHWRFRLSNRAVTWTDAISGHQQAKLPAISDPVLVTADGATAPGLAAVVDDIAYGITHVIRADDGAGATGVYLDILSALGSSGTIAFAHLPALGDIGRRAIHDFRRDGVEAEALVRWLTGDRFNPRRLARVPDAADLPRISRDVLARREFAAVADRLPQGATERFWLAIRGHIDLLTEARHWWDVVNGTIFPEIPDGAADLLAAARATLPAEPWDSGIWSAWLAAIPPETRDETKLRLILTGEDQGPELASLLPLIGRPRVLERLRGA